MISPKYKVFFIHVPKCAGSSINVAFWDMDNATEESDDGWMYVNFDDARPSVLELTTREVDPVPHFIWPTDSF